MLSLALAATACNRGCTCIAGETVFDRYDDGPVEAELVRTTHWAGGRLPGPVSNFSIRVHTEPPFDEPVSCSEVEFAGDQAGRFLAFRCAGVQAWTVLRLFGGDVRVRECEVVGGDEGPDFAALPPLRERTIEVLRCALDERRELGHTLAGYVRAIESEDGPEQAAVILRELADKQLYDERGHDAWLAGLTALSEPARSGIEAEVCATLASPDASARAYLRAAQHCPLVELGPTAIAPTAIAQLDRRLADAREPSGSRRSLSLDAEIFGALEWAAVLGVGANPEAAGTWACDQAELLDFGDGDARRQAELLADMLVATQSPCPALEPWLQVLDPCEAGLRVGQNGERRAYTLAELSEGGESLRSSFAAELSDTGLRPGRKRTNNPGRSLLAALLVTGEGRLPEPLAGRIASLDCTKD